MVVKLTPFEACQVWILLKWYCAIGPDGDANISEIWQQIHRRGIIPPDTARALERYMGGDYGQLGSIVNSMTAQLEAEGEGQTGGEKKLIDVLVEIVQNPYGKSLLSAQTYQSLKTALLIPKEAFGLADRLHKKEYACFLCGTLLQPNVVGTLKQDGYGNVGLVCAECVPPTFTVCSHEDCTCMVPLPSGTVKMFDRGLQCEAHRAEKNGETPKEKKPEQAPIEFLGIDIEQATTAIPTPPRDQIRAFQRAMEQQAAARRWVVRAIEPGGPINIGRDGDGN